MPYIANDPLSEAAMRAGQLAYEYLKKKTDEDKAKIENGTVSYTRRGDSHENSTPWVMYEYIATNRGNDITGSTTGVVVEWLFHNWAYSIGDAFNIQSMKNPAEHVDVGKTIYSDYREGFGAAAWMSLGMKLSYTFALPIHAAYDLGMETGRWDHVYPRE